MGFIETFLKKESKNITKEDVEIFVRKRMEENMNFDYTDIKSYFKFDESSRDVSAFANSEGGLIILGVSEERTGKKVVKIYPKDITWGEETLTKERLEDNLIAKIKPNINGLKIIPIREGNGSHRVIFLIDIPKSDNPPHMASDNRYWKRINFRKKPMEHYDVAHLFKISSTMKEKLIEEIHIPLSSILDKQIKALEKYNCPSGHDIDEILSKTYYKMQMPWELFEYLDYYNDQIKNLHRLEYFSNKELRIIINNNLVKLLKISPITAPIDELTFRIKAGYNKSSLELYPQYLFELLMTNKTIKDYLLKVYYQHTYEVITIEFSNETYETALEDFEERVWDMCLKEVSDNENIIQMKKKSKELEDLAWDLLDKITSY